MAERRPKIVLLGDAASSAAPLLGSLGDQCIPLPASEDALARLTADGDALVIATPEGIQSLMRQARQSAMLLETIGEGVCLAMADGTIVWANARFESLSAQSREKITGFCTQASAWFATRTADGTSAADAMECRFELEDAEDAQWHDVLILPSDAANGATLAVVVRDITATRRIEQKIEAVTQAGHDLASLEAESVAKMDVIERLELLRKKVIRYCHDLLSFDHFAIRLVDPKTGKLELLMSAGLPEEAIELDLTPALEGQGICGHVAASGISYICHDITQERLFLPGLANARSCLTVPLRLHDSIIGVIDIESDALAAFSEEDRRFTEIFARYIALAIHMLDLLVVERTTTNKSVSGRFEGELSEPLEDIVHEADWLTRVAERDPEAAAHVERIRSDVDVIRRRVRGVAAGPQSLLGVDSAMAVRRVDPLLAKKRVLIADDDPNIRRIIRDVLHNRGVAVRTCAGGREAIAALADGTLDLVISDIKMPDRNGYQLFSAVKKAQPDVPVILMTGFGYDPNHSIVRASQEGLQSVLFKPFQVQRLLDEIRRALAPPRQASDSQSH